MMRQVDCEIRKLFRSKTLFSFVGVSLLLSLMTSMSSLSGGPLFMTAGNPMGEMGNTLGFIGNYVDPQTIPESAVRTAFVYTPFWLPLIVLFIVSGFSSDYIANNIVVSKAKGLVMARVLVAKAVVNYAVIGLCYGISSFASFLYKAHQYGAQLENADYLLFFTVLSINIFLLFALASTTVLLVVFTHSALLSTMSSLVLIIFVLVGYPSLYGLNEAGLIENGFFSLSPIYYLLGTCSLNFAHAPLLTALCFALASIVIQMVLSSVVVTRRRYN